ncbi:MAG: flagellar hook-associated protein 3, partial [Lachnospiraceae bacterium]|nr:flagellar hook-associated protein 3 [Lachnospiraceae bacterium]
MRITNNMIMSNTKININGNKTSLDTLNNQMSSQKKISSPADDPVVAIRALRLRSNLSQINQYYEKNIPDAESWLEVTETALTNMKK